MTSMTTPTGTGQAIAGALRAALRGEVIDRDHPATTGRVGSGTD